MVEFRKPKVVRQWRRAIFKTGLVIAKSYFQDPISAAESVPDLWRDVWGEIESKPENEGWLFLQSLVTTGALLVLNSPRMHCSLSHEELEPYLERLCSCIPEHGVLEPQDLTLPHTSVHLNEAIKAFPCIAKEVAPGTFFDLEELSLRFEEALGRAVSLVYASRAPELSGLRNALSGPLAEAEKRTVAWRRHAAWIRAQFSEVPIFSPESDPEKEFEIPLSEVYMRLRCFWNENKQCDKDAREPQEYRTAHIADLHDTVTAWLNDKTADSSLRLIAGGPGCGKSSFAKAFASETQSLEKWRVLFIRLQHVKMNGTLRESIAGFLKRRDGWNDHVKCEGFYGNPLAWHGEDTRPLLMIFDGLDELTANEDREKDITRQFVSHLRAELSDLKAAGKDARAIVLGREPAILPALEDADLPLDNLINVAPIRPIFSEDLKLGRDPWDEISDEGRALVFDPQCLMNIDERPKYWKRWLRIKGDEPSDIPPALTDERMEDLNVEPLLLHLLIISDFCGGRWQEAAENRNLVYEDILTKVFERNKRKGLDAYKKLEKKNFFELMEVFGLAAFRGNGRTGNHEEFVTLRSRYVGKKRDESLYRSIDGADLKNVALMIHTRQEVEGAGFEFVHKSFGEYLAARALIGCARVLVKNSDRDYPMDLANTWIGLVGGGSVSGAVHSFLTDELRFQKHEDLRDIVDLLTSVFDETLMQGFPVHQHQDFTEANFRRLEANQRLVEKAMLTLLTTAWKTHYGMQANGSPPVNIALRSLSEDPLQLMGMLQRAYILAEGPATLAGLDGSHSLILNLSLMGADLTGANLKDAQFVEVGLTGALLVGANLAQANLVRGKLTKANLSNANLEEANLIGAVLKETNLTGAHCQNANLMAVDLKGAKFIRANLVEANLERARLEGASLERANLQGADLNKARLEGASFKSADLRGCIFTGTSLRSVDFSEECQITYEQLAAGFGVKEGIGETVLPSDWPAPDHWHVPPEGTLDERELYMAYLRDYRRWSDEQPDVSAYETGSRFS